MKQALKAGALYFAMVFAFAFAVGVVRVLIVAPRVGPLAAVMLEAPLVIAVSGLAARWCVTRLGVGQGTGIRLAMGFFAFALLMAAELAGSVLMSGLTPAQHFAAFLQPAGAVGLLAQIVFALVPFLSRTGARSG